MKAADHAAAAVKEATKEMDRVSAHLEQLLKEREAEEAEDAAEEAKPKPHHHKTAAVANNSSAEDKSANITRASNPSPAATASPAR